MKKKFDVNKFLTILSEPRKHKKLLNKEGKHPYGFEYPNEFGLDTDEFYYEIPDLITALEDAGYKDLIKINQDTDEERDIFDSLDELGKDFKRLDKSFNYSPIFHLRDTPEPDDGLYYYVEECAYVSTKKSKYSFLISASDYNVNYDFSVIKVFENIIKENKKTFPKIALDLNASGTLGKDSHYCQWIFLNSAYNWGTESEYKLLMSKNKFPQSLKKRFLPTLKNKIKFSKNCGNKPSDIKEINSLIAIINEKRILNKSFRPLNAWTGKGTKLGKGEVWEFVK